MKLPHLNRATVPKAKITNYLLSLAHPEGKGKALFFMRLGFAPGEWAVLAKALRQHAARHDVTRKEDSPFGTRYVIEGRIETPSRRRPRIRAVWFIERGAPAPRFVTAYPLKEG